MAIYINLVPRKSIRERVWKTLNVVVGITTILNVSMVGALIRPVAANAAVNDANPIYAWDRTPAGSAGWGHGQVSGYYEGENIAFKLEFEGLTAGVPQTVHVTSEYIRGGIMGIEKFQHPNAPADAAVITFNADRLAFTMSEATILPGDPSYLSYEFTFTPTDTTATLYWDALIAVGAHNYPGSSLNVRYTEGSRTIPIATNEFMYHALSITKSDSPDPINLNDSTTYTIVASNNGFTLDGESNFTVTDTLPAGMSYNDSATPTPTSVVGQVITWNFGTVDDGDTKTITYKAKGITIGTHTNTAVLSADGATPATVTEPTTVNGQYNLTVIKHVTNDNGGLKTAANFTMHVSNGTPTSFAGDESGTLVSIPVGSSFNVTEDADSGYDMTSSGTCSGTMTAGANLTCTITNDDKPGTLTVKKILYNGNAGNAVVTDFSFTINGGDSIAFEADARNDLTVNAGTYTVVENPAPGYATTYSNCTNVVIPNGGSATCYVVNSDIAPTITLIKKVINDNGGTAGVNNFGLTIGGTAVNSGETLNVNSNTPIALDEVGLFGYSFVNITGDAKCPSALKGTVTLDEGEHVTCTITNDDQTARLIVKKILPNDNGGTATANLFSFKVNDSSPITFETDAQNDLIVNAGTYSVVETNPMPGYAVSYDNCTDVVVSNGGTATCTITNDDIQPKLIVIKHVVNDNGGTATADQFTLNVSGNGPTPTSFAGSETGTEVAINQGDYEVTEEYFAGYAPVYGTDCNGNIKVGETKTCIVTNTAQAAHLIVIKHVDNGTTGGSKVAGDFNMHISGVTVPASADFSGAEAPGIDRIVYPGSYSVTEDTVAGYIGSSSADCSGRIALGETKICTITNTAQQATLTIIKTVINDNGGTKAASDFTIDVTGSAITTSLPGAAAPGTTLNVNPGSFVVHEGTYYGYTASYSGDCTSTISLGEHKACTVTNTKLNPAKIIATKIVCDKESDLPDWGVNTPSSADISASTATQYIADHPTCHLQPNWIFQWGLNPINNPGDNTGAASAATGWTSFGPTDSAGQAMTMIDNLAGSSAIWVREVMNSDYLPFSGALDTADKQLSAELYCHTDVLNYDNYEWIDDLQYDTTYYCVGFNVLKQARLTVNKVVNNNHGGLLDATSFPLFIDTTPVTNGIPNTLNSGTYTVSEQMPLPAGYVQTSITCDGLPTDTITLLPGDDKTCTITNEDIAPKLTLVKQVVNTLGTPEPATSWTLKADGTTTPLSGTTPVVSGPDFKAGTYTLSEENGPIGYGPSAWICTMNDLPFGITGDQITIGLDQEVTCTITNTRDTGTVIVHKMVDINGDGKFKEADDVTTDEGANALGFRWLLDSDATNRNMGTSAPVTTIDTHAVSENSVPNYHYAGYFIGQGTCNDPQSFQSLPSFKVVSGGTTHITLCNARDTGSLTLIKHVTNNNGGLAVATDWLLHVKQGDTDISDSPVAGSETGTDYDLLPTGDYVISESDGPTGYAQTSIVCDGVVTDTVTVTTDSTKTCIITNDDIQPKLTVTKVVINNEGGSKVVSDFPLYVGTTGVTSGVQNVFNAGAYKVSETSLAGYVGTITGDCAADGSITLAVGDVKACTITNNDIAPRLSITKTNNIIGFTNPGKQVTYTVTVTNAVAANDTARAVVLTDVLPAGFTYAVIGGATRTFALGDIAPGASVVTTYIADISTTQLAGTYTNTASAKGSNTPTVSATSDVEVRVPTVLGVASIASLVLTKTVHPTIVNAGQVVIYTVTISNPSDINLTNVTLTDILPKGFTFVDDGKTTKTWFIGELKANHERVINYQVKVGSNVKAGKYENTATVTSDQLDPQTVKRVVEVRVPKVLGLATTGVTARDYLIFGTGFSLLAIGLYLVYRARRRSDGTDLA